MFLTQKWRFYPTRNSNQYRFELNDHNVNLPASAQLAQALQLPLPRILLPHRQSIGHSTHNTHFTQLEIRYFNRYFLNPLVIIHQIFIFRIFSPVLK